MLAVYVILFSRIQVQPFVYIMRPLCMLVIAFLAAKAKAAPLPDGSTIEMVFAIPPSLTANPTPSPTDETILSQHQHLSLNGDYEFGYVSSNGIEVEEKGGQKEIEGPDGVKTFGTASSGKYSYHIIEDGKVKKMTVVWTADEQGFRPFITVSDF